MKRLKWESHGYEQLGNCPPLTIHETVLGEDADGVVWLCRVKYAMNRKQFMVSFDKDTNEGDDSPFLRNEVVYADNYWEEHQRVHHTVFCQYESIQGHIEMFMVEHKIDTNH